MILDADMSSDLEGDTNMNGHEVDEDSEEEKVFAREEVSGVKL